MQCTLHVPIYLQHPFTPNVHGTTELCQCVSRSTALTSPPPPSHLASHGLGLAASQAAGWAGRSQPLSADLSPCQCHQSAPCTWPHMCPCACVVMAAVDVGVCSKAAGAAGTAAAACIISIMHSHPGNGLPPLKGVVKANQHLSAPCAGMSAAWSVVESTCSFPACLRF